MIRYQLALFGHSQRYLFPGLAFLALLSVLYGAEAGSPAPPEFAVSAGVLTVVACWLTITLVDVEDPAQRLITLAHARKLSTMVIGLVLALLACCAGLTVLALIWSIVAHGGDSLGDLGSAALAHLAAASAGIAIGLPCSRLLVPRIVYSAFAAPIALAVVLMSRWLPLVNPMLRALSSNRPAAFDVVVGLLTSLLALAVSAVAVTVLVERRS
ncbi:hypothetical protein [Amycolatopsis taiwanensis]|uniref:Uncharacterized protein n=1 Tax=Amycolatopsis taiwanensis TaxID=342230 RepID=A0A9W6VGA9_9PSEU|nr:hypothetical protein [Amycolatopsis taiwanensis]GLY67595.1 hypothetical protein Atai01_42140 [Amycolatopsis taiwanensis]